MRGTRPRNRKDLGRNSERSEQSGLSNEPDEPGPEKEGRSNTNTDRIIETDRARTASMAAQTFYRSPCRAGNGRISLSVKRLPDWLLPEKAWNRYIYFGCALTNLRRSSISKPDRTPGSLPKIRGLFRPEFATRRFRVPRPCRCFERIPLRCGILPGRNKMGWGMMKRQVPDFRLSETAFRAGSRRRPTGIFSSA